VFLNLYRNHGNSGLMSLVTMANRVIRKILLHNIDSRNTSSIEQRKNPSFRMHFQHETFSTVLRHCTLQPSANSLDM
jgi:hypothetical protein